jgi:hypothetical protein
VLDEMEIVVVDWMMGFVEVVADVVVDYEMKVAVVVLVARRK